MKKLLVVLAALCLVFGIANSNANAETGASGDPIQFQSPMWVDGHEQEIGAGETLYFQVYRANGMELSVRGANVEIIIGDESYPSDGTAAVAVLPSGGMPGAPVDFKVRNTGSEAQTFVFGLKEPMGSANNPKPLDSISTITTVLEANDMDGYTYVWIAEGSGTLTLDGNFTGEGTEAVVLNNVTQNIYNDTAFADEDGFPVSVKVATGDKITINVHFYDGAPGTIVLNGTFTEATGASANDAIFVIEDFEKAINADSTLYFSTMAMGGMVMTVEGENIAIVYDGEEVATSQNGKAVYTLPQDYPTDFQIKNKGNVATTVKVTFGYPEGHYENPYIIDTPYTFEGAFVASYNDIYFKWVAPEAGTFYFNIYEGLDVLTAVNMYNPDNYDMYVASEWLEEGETTLMLEVEEGDVILVQVQNENEEADVVFGAHFVSEVTEVTVGEISQAEKGETVVVGVQEDGTIAIEVLEAAKENEVNLKVENTEKGYTWVIDATTLPDDLASVMINLDVTIGGTSVVPEAVLKTVEKENFVALSLAHNGAFGFDAELSFKIDAKYAGKEATLYYYNTATGKLENQGKVIVGKNGEVAYDFEHASDYIIAINEPVDTESSGTGEANFVAIAAMFLVAGAGLFVLRRKMR